MNTAYDALTRRLAELVDLQRAQFVLGWDQEVMMPAGGATARANQQATLARVEHQKWTDAEMERLLDAAANEVAPLPADSFQASQIRIAQRDRADRIRIPTDLAAEMAHTASLASGAWVEARRTNSYTLFAPWLEKQVSLMRQLTDCLGYAHYRYEALLNITEPGMSYTALQQLFSDLRAGLVPLLRTIAERVDRVDTGVLDGIFATETQLSLSRQIAADLGYDFERGRLDLTAHPFCSPFARDDVRITTRVFPNNLECIMSVIHETGHALYEQGIAPNLAGTVLGMGTSPGVHESQSRLWENLVARGRPFVHFLYPRLQAAFPAVLGAVTEEQYYCALNAVRPSCIRVDADEVTYNLHIMLRVGIEHDLLEGNLSVADVPAIWNTRMTTDVGITPPDDSQGCLQDMHWASGFGGFHGYTLGNVIAAQLFDVAHHALPDLDSHLTQGDTTPLLGWLRHNVHQYGRIYDPEDLVRRATGSPLSVAPYLTYLRSKYLAIYQ